MKQFRLLALALLCLLSVSMYAQDMTAKNKASITAAYNALNHRDWDAFASYCAPGYTELNVGPAPVKGIQEAIGLYKQFFTAFPDFMVKIEEIVPESPTRFLIRVTVTGTNSGPVFMLPPTGKSIKAQDIDVLEFDASGKAISHGITNPGEPFRQIGYGSLTNPSTMVVMNDAYANFGKGDVAAIQNACTPDVVFELQDRMFDSKARWFKGKSGVGDFFQELGSKFKYTKFQPTRFVADGDDVFVTIDAEYVLTATGKTYTTTYTHHFIVKNGKIAYFRGLDDFQTEK